ncbi:MAG: phage head closure protein [Pseudomonadota bacterium]
MKAALSDLRHRVTIEARSVLPDGAGGQIESWVPGEEVWAAVVPLSGVEALRQDRIATTVTHRVRVRYRSDLDAAKRLRMGDRVLEILSVIDVDERHRWIDCLCEEKNL